jgi:hypothetical protein
VNLRQSPPATDYDEFQVLADAAAGLPELAALYRLTKDRRWLEAFESMIASFPRPFNGTYADVYRTQKLPVMATSHSDGRRIPFFVSVVVAHALLPRPALAAAIARLSVPPDAPPAWTYGLAAVAELVRDEQRLPGELSAAWARLLSPPDGGDRPVLRALAGEGIVALAIAKGGDPLYREMLEERLKAVIPPVGVYAGERTTSSGRVVEDGILHSEFFALWMKAAALLAGNDGILKGAIINEAGHILALEAGDG